MESRIWHRYYDKGITATMAIPEITIYDVLARARDNYPKNTATYLRGK